jgi:hypothetical protein
MQNDMVEFENIVKVKQKIVTGSMYYITIQVNEGGVKKLYEAKVWEKLWENFKQLMEFNSVEDSPTLVTGGIEDITMGHENDLHFIDLARFAISEHNKKNVRHLPHLPLSLYVCHVPVCKMVGRIFSHSYLVSLHQSRLNSMLLSNISFVLCVNKQYKSI